MKNLLLLWILMAVAPLHAQAEPPSDASIRELMSLAKSEQLVDYKSEAGKALIEKMPLIMQRSMTTMTEKVQSLSPKLQALQQETSRKLREAADK